MGFDFSQSNVFKFESLGFLLSTPNGRRAFENLQFVERTYLDLSARHMDFNATTQELQRSIATLHTRIANVENLPLKELEPLIGPELSARVIDHQRAIMLRIDRDEDRYTAAFVSLNDAMVERYGEEARMAAFTIPNGFRRDDLPPLPPMLRSYVDSIPATSP
jgi:hypothetical protein